MPETFEYQVRDNSGKMVAGTLVADNQELVIERLREMGMVPVKVRIQKSALGRDINFRRSVKLKDLAIFSRQFATMVNAGLPILRALSVLEGQTTSHVLKKAIEAVRVDIERGSSLSVAMAKHPKVFSKLYVSMVRSGEMGGILDGVLLRLSQNLERDVALRNRIRSAMTYPIVVLGFVTLILIAMLVFIVPQFKSIYAGLHGTLPLLTRLLLTVSDVIRHDFLIVAVILAGVWYALRRYKKTEPGRKQADRLKLKVPVFGPLFLKTALSRFARTLGVLNKSGVPILQSLEIVSETVNNSLVKEAVLDVQESVKQGESLARPLKSHKIFPPMVVQMLAVGEETGSLDIMLEKVGDFYDDEVTTMVDQLTSLIEPIMIAMVGGVVGIAVVALYLPMFNIINLIK
ncbi:MAG TPA: type II secretion system F family protein [Actinomycetota bacterium]|nr:type II secretion system F family protein [Actinomycetota bacterium]